MAAERDRESRSASSLLSISALYMARSLAPPTTHSEFKVLAPPTQIADYSNGMWPNRTVS